MENQFKKGVSRRQFLGTAAIGVAGVAMFSSLAACKQNITDTDLKLGIIGMGQQAMFLLNSFLQIPGVKVIAGCDVYGVKRQRFEKKVNEFYSTSSKPIEIQTYERYEDLLARTDINAVIIAVPDHSHARIAIAACKAGKDVYLEKPMTLTIFEGQELRRVVRETNRILAIGSQQRSDPNFQHAVQLVQSGALGQIETVNAYVGAPPTAYDLPEESIPADLNWDLWLGSLSNPPVHYNNLLNPPITIDPEQNEQFWGGWRWYKEMGGGFTTDWGAHMFDIVQWGLGMDKNGPVEISPIGDGTSYMKFVYANGVVMTSEPFDEGNTKGVKFTGKDGWIEVSRSHFKASDDKFLPPASAEGDDGPYETKIPHQINFIESVRERKDPIVPVEIGHSSCTVCTLGNIACDLKRTIKWDPATETFVDDVDGEATKKLHYEYREGWNLV